MIMNNIPKKIHYCWFGGAELPDSAKKCIESWKKFCPEYEIIRWDEHNYDYVKFIYTRQAYEAKKYAFVSDVARLEVVYRYGGIYLDTDVELIKPLDDLLKNKAFMGVETTSVALGLGFGAVPKLDFLEQLINKYKTISFYKNDGSLELKTIPAYTMELLAEKGYVMSDGIQFFEGITIYPKEYFNPKNYLTGELCITSNTYSIHHYDATWWGENEKQQYEMEQNINKYCGKIGLKIYHALKILKKQGLTELINRFWRD